jgi:hypothetical protein
MSLKTQFVKLEAWAGWARGAKPSAPHDVPLATAEELVAAIAEERR